MTGEILVNVESAADIASLFRLIEQSGERNSQRESQECRPSLAEREELLANLRNLVREVEGIYVRIRDAAY